MQLFIDLIEEKYYDHYGFKYDDELKTLIHNLKFLSAQKLTMDKAYLKTSGNYLVTTKKETTNE